MWSVLYRYYVLLPIIKLFLQYESFGRFQKCIVILVLSKHNVYLVFFAVDSRTYYLLFLTNYHTLGSSGTKKNFTPNCGRGVRFRAVRRQGGAEMDKWKLRGEHIFFQGPTSRRCSSLEASSKALQRSWKHSLKMFMYMAGLGYPRIRTFWAAQLWVNITNDLSDGGEKNDA